MSIDLKKRPHKEIHSNQNYLNFIKKNHQLMYLLPNIANKSLLGLPISKDRIIPNHSLREAVLFLSKKTQTLIIKQSIRILTKDRFMIHFPNFSSEGTR
jgi:hypothetical protein